jgi:hypothetical protein
VGMDERSIISDFLSIKGNIDVTTDENLLSLEALQKRWTLHLMSQRLRYVYAKQFQ